MKIMFICTGNICRSAMAEAMLKKMLKDKKIENVEVYSCGTYAQTGDVPTLDAIEVMEEYGIDLKAHRATNIKESNIEEMDIILCATLSHKGAVISLYPELSKKVFTMKEYANFKDDYNISDPWGYGIAVYRKCAAEIEQCLEKIVKVIIQSL